ncbi:MAG: hypothetical protein Q7U38_15135 [Methylobacter sp.]|nr:hypothetical protein [Methylobacter sp.]MDP2097507.1 hypothetical protein [Methylobacter sp.]MDP2429348.1 hypothetical protein [Methylobacter sp.]MDP3053773.1 hypothetical protein [Methylobacter sp.]MDP3362756.1 hypothetical protein [Methylobacter sp.]
MNKKNLALTLGGAMATILTASPMVNAQENPFGLQKISGAQVLAEADAKMPEGGCSGKLKEGKCGEGKCGANKMKMKEGGCSGTAKPEKMKEGGCSGKMKEGGCSGKM